MAGNLWNNPWTYVVFILVVVGVFYLSGNIGGSAVAEDGQSVISEDGQYDDFAKYLTSQGVVMYGVGWCSHCQNQKKEFGSSFQYIDFVDCDDERDVCLSAGVQGYPTWKINGQNYPGEQSLEKLASLTGYKN